MELIAFSFRLFNEFYVIIEKRQLLGIRILLASPKSSSLPTRRKDASSLSRKKAARISNVGKTRASLHMITREKHLWKDDLYFQERSERACVCGCVCVHWLLLSDDDTVVAWLDDEVDEMLERVLCAATHRASKSLNSRNLVISAN